MHKKPKETMREVAVFLNIQFEEELLRSTFGGLLHWGDNTKPARYGFNTTRQMGMLKNEMLTFDSKDIKIIEDLVDDRIIHFGYERISLRKKITKRRLRQIWNWEKLAILTFLGKRQDDAVYGRVVSLSNPLCRKLGWIAASVAGRLDKEQWEGIRIWERAVARRIALCHDYLGIPSKERNPKFAYVKTLN